MLFVDDTRGCPQASADVLVGEGISLSGEPLSSFIYGGRSTFLQEYPRWAVMGLAKFIRAYTQ